MGSSDRSAPDAKGPLERLLDEALARLASAPVSSRILADALSDAGLDRLPRDPAEFGSFLCGPLHARIEAALGPDAADSVVVDLRPAFMVDPVRPATSGVRARGRMSVPPPHSGAQVVLVASPVPARVDALIPRLRDRVKVVAAYDVFSLLTAAQRYLTQPIVLVLDDAMPAVQRATVATLGRVLPPGTRILSWGEGDRAPPWPPGAARQVRWEHLGAVSLEAVAQACLDGLDDPTPTAPPPRRVLVAHADARWRHAATRRLEAAGYDVISAPDGFMALERCIDEAPAVVLAACRMPTLDGAQLAALLDGRFGDRAPRVVLLGESDGAPGAACVVARAPEDAELEALVVDAAGQAPEN